LWWIWVRVETPDKLDIALQNALKSGRPAIVEVVIDPDKTAASTKKID
jgi:pyruvate oxidase